MTADRIKLLEEARVRHNDRLRSAAAIAARDGLDTNWKAFRAQCHYTLAEYHDLVNSARAALSSQEAPGAIDQGGGVERQCTVCTAIVSSYPEGMCCHCREMPWPLRSSDQAEPQRMGGRAAFSLWAATIERDVRVSELTEEEIGRLLAALRQSPVDGDAG